MSDDEPPARHPDLSDLRSLYSLRISRTLWWVWAGVFGLNLVAAVLRLLGDPSGGDIALAVLQVVGYSLILLIPLRIPAAIALRPDGLRFRRLGRFGPLVPWGEIAEVKVQGRWDDSSSIVLRDGRRRVLVGMPAEDAQRLADALIDSGSPGHRG